MAFRSRSQSIKRINTRLEGFLAQKLGAENVEYYDQESCIEENKKTIFLNKFMFKLLLICDDRFYITDNPPSSLDNFIMFEDVIDFKIINDFPKFLTGHDKENSLHIVIDYYKNPKRKKELEMIKSKVIELKKSMIYSKSIDNKLLETELNTSRSSYNSKKDTDQDLSSILTYRGLTSYIINEKEKTFGNDAEMTSRTNKSVRFDETVKVNEPEQEKDTVGQYKNLTQLVSKTEGFKNMLDKDVNLFTLDLPLTPRSLDGKSILDFSLLGTEKNVLYLNYQACRTFQNVNDKINSDFIKDCDKKPASLDIYILNPRTQVYQSLKQAHFLSKIRDTLNYHSTLEEQFKIVKNNFEDKSNIDKKFKLIKAEIFRNVDSLERISCLYDNLLQLTYDYKFIKKIFWNSSDLYTFSTNQLNRYLPNSVASMKRGLSSGKRRIKELEACIAFIETISIMFQETEFYANRNQVLYEEKCKNIRSLTGSLICQPEMAELDHSFESFELKKKLEEQMTNLVLVSSILLWEMVHCLSLNSWNCADLTLEIFVKNIELSSSLEFFINALIAELSKLVNSQDSVLLSAKETVIFYKTLSLLFILIEKSSTTKILDHLKANLYEEFKYYFNEERIRLKTYIHYPITNELIAVVKKLQKIIL